MSDRKYRQHGYQDDDRGKRPSGDAARRPVEPRDPRIPRDPRVPNMPGFRQVFRCARCGALESTDIGSLSRCGKCGTALRACVNCESFDSGARFECRQAIPKRVSPKDEPNDCPLYAPRLTVERETGSQRAAEKPSAAKKALDDLFKF
ncbi:MAG TPA: hypothetical protein VMM93_08720 [Vicinamibacterales bacterium]|nr:hypothetical protein [Vicinamibacterales bacterium]